MQEQPENNGRIRNNGTFRAGSNQMRAVDGKQRIYLEWPNLPTYNNHGAKKNHLATKSSAQIKLPGLY